MTKQPAALHYAEVLENFYLGLGRMDATGAAAELRRLYEVNQELLKAVKECQNAIQGGQILEIYDIRGAGYQQCFGAAFLDYLNAVIAKADGGAA